MSFNPRARVEPDVARLGRGMGLTRFQSTGSRGARRVVTVRLFSRFIVSIHGLAWSPTRSDKGYVRGRFGFNPRARVEPDPRIGRSG